MKRFQNRPAYAVINGFTITELLIVISIIAILLAVAGLFMRRMVVQARVEQQAQQIYADLVYARSRAMNYNRIQFVLLTPANSQYQIWDDTFPAPDGDGILTTAPGNDTLVTSTITRDQLWVNPAGFTQFQLDNRGIVSGTGTIGLTNVYQAAFDCIAVSPTRIRLGRWDGVANCVQSL